MIVHFIKPTSYTTPYCPNRPLTDTNLEPGAMNDSYSVNRSLKTVILSPDFCLQNYSLRHRTHQFSLPDHTGL